MIVPCRQLLGRGGMGRAVTRARSGPPSEVIRPREACGGTPGRGGETEARHHQALRADGAEGGGAGGHVHRRGHGPRQGRRRTRLGPHLQAYRTVREAPPPPSPPPRPPGPLPTRTHARTSAPPASWDAHPVISPKRAGPNHRCCLQDRLRQGHTLWSTQLCGWNSLLSATVYSRLSGLHCPDCEHS